MTSKRCVFSVGCVVSFEHCGALFVDDSVWKIDGETVRGIDIYTRYMDKRTNGCALFIICVVIFTRKHSVCVAILY